MHFSALTNREKRKRSFLETGSSWSCDNTHLGWRVASFTISILVENPRVTTWNGISLAREWERWNLDEGDLFYSWPGFEYIGPFVLLAKWISDSDFLVSLSGPCCEFRVLSIVLDYAINWIIEDLEARGIYFSSSLDAQVFKYYLLRK